MYLYSRERDIKLEMREVSGGSDDFSSEMKTVLLYFKRLK